MKVSDWAFCIFVVYYFSHNTVSDIPRYHSSCHPKSLFEKISVCVRRTGTASLVLDWHANPESPRRPGCPRRVLARGPIRQPRSISPVVPRAGGPAGGPGRGAGGGGGTGGRPAASRGGARDG